MKSFRTLVLPIVLLVGAMFAGGCAPEGPEYDVLSDSLASDNGLSTNGVSTNGVSTNGLSTNGLSTNGLSTNGLSTNGLSTNGFAAWFTGQPGGTAYADMVMKYVVRCALASGSSLSYTSGGATYTWAGALGLAPTWAAGSAIPVAEQQLISACLGAHANKYGVPVAISVRGYYASGSYIPVSESEQSGYPNDEGCVFGNLFDGTGVFTAYSASSPLLTQGKSSLRACMTDNGQPGSCSPMVATGSTCQALCSGTSGGVSTWFQFQSCTWKGVSYRPISTRLRGADIASCGNGVCQASESATTCPADCH